VTVLCVESGGTFTDFCVIPADGAVRLVKIPSDRTDPHRALLRGIEALNIDLAAVTRVSHGTTVGVNAILEQRGARVALLTTRGFSDVLQIQREYKDWNYDLRYRKPVSVVAETLADGVDERLDAAGVPIRPLTPAEVERVVRWVSAANVDAVAICLLHAYRNPVHEQRLLEAISEALPGVGVAISSEISPQIQEFERASTTVLAAYTLPTIARYLDQLQAFLGERNFTGDLLVMQCSGGLVTHDEALRNPAPSILSGPAAGARGALRVAAQERISSFVGMDIGGTSTDVFIVEGGQVKFTDDARIGRWPLNVARLDVRSVGSGGGSKLQMIGSALAVGPESAGAFPGPAAYGHGGTEPTLTDALVVDGILAPGRQLGGEIRLDAAAARAALSSLADASPAGPSDSVVEEIAEAAIRIAITDIANQIRLLTLEQGLDPRDFWLVAYGGAGPMLGLWVAEELELAGVIVPAGAGVLSAYGLAACGYRKDHLVSMRVPLSGAAASGAPAAVNAVLTAALKLPGLDPAQLEVRFGRPVTVSVNLGIRYRGQGHDLEVEVGREFDPASVLDQFHQLHERTYGYRADSDPVDIAKCRITVEVAFDPPAPLRLPDELAPQLAGPVTIALPDTTVVIPAGWRGELTAAGNLRFVNG